MLKGNKYSSSRTNIFRYSDGEYCQAYVYLLNLVLKLIYFL